MRPGAHIVLLNAARFYAPLIALLAGVLLVTRTPGEGVGFVAGLVFAGALSLHVLVFGAIAARAALPPFVARILLCAALIAAVLGVAAPRLPLAAQMAEAGLFAATAAGAALLLTVLIARAPTLRGEDS